MQCSLTHGRTDSAHDTVDNVQDPIVVSNRLLAALPRRQQQRFQADCDNVALALTETLAEPGERALHVYFPTAGFISLIVKLDNGAQLEIGIVGNEGMLGASIALGIDISPQYAIVQCAGTALRMSAAAFRRHCRQSAELREAVSRYVYVSMSQLAQTAACTHYHLVEARLARWLLMTRDRAGADSFHLTQALLASMLGVRRAGITQAAHALQARGLIRYTRGDITIVDAQGLQTKACECYERSNEIYEQTFGPPHRPASAA
jgi:CRP-like cAMP-binding protein